MATRTLTETRTIDGRRVSGTNAVALAASDTTSLINVIGTNKLRAEALMATTFGTGTITITVYGSIDGTNLNAIGTISITAAPTAPETTVAMVPDAGASNQPVNLLSANECDISGYNFIQLGRGGDSNTGTVTAFVRAYSRNN